MSDGTEISWSDATWNVVTGCTKVSAGCDHCYIERTPPFRIGGRRFDKPGVGGTTGVRIHGDRLFQPFRWRKPRRIFVCSLADLFHDAVPDRHIAKTWATMARTPQHTYQVLTKRPARMRSMLSSETFREMVTRQLLTDPAYSAPGMTPTWPIPKGGLPWPLPNVWVGTSTEDQASADLRVPILLRTPAAVRWVSAEPLLGPLDLSPWLNPEKTCERCDGEYEHACRSCPFDKAVILDEDFDEATGHQPIRRLSWVVTGGESGPRARPMHPDWARSLRDQCAAAGVPFHFKQWGELVTEDQSPDDITLPGVAHRLLDEDGPAFFRVGKKAAGRLLDGELHDAYPTIREETNQS